MVLKENLPYMVESSNLIEKADEYVYRQMLIHLPKACYFHNYEYSIEIVDVATQLLASLNLPEETETNIILAAWFYNLGFVKNSKKHLVYSARMVRDFLQTNFYEEENIKQVENLILGSDKTSTSSSVAQKVLHDAIWSFLGRKRFFRRSKLLRLEQEQMNNEKRSARVWNTILLNRLLDTPFYTLVAQRKYNVQKNKNISKQQDILDKAIEKTTKLKTGKHIGRGIDTLYRTTLRNHLNLSSIADGKAGMIININTLVLSVLITAGTAGLSINYLSFKSSLHIIAPIIILMVSSLTAIIFAVLSAVPNVDRKTIDMEEVKAHKVSLLFFGNFLQLKRNDFIDYIKALKKDQDILYDDLSRDLYNLGLVLKKKYVLLTIAYRIFVGGLISAVFTFLIIYFIVAS